MPNDLFFDKPNMFAELKPHLTSGSNYFQILTNGFSVNEDGAKIMQVGSNKCGRSWHNGLGANKSRQKWRQWVRLQTHWR
jgi:hypothetical protein